METDRTEGMCALAGAVAVVGRRQTLWVPQLISLSLWHWCVLVRWVGSEWLGEWGRYSYAPNAVAWKKEIKKKNITRASLSREKEEMHSVNQAHLQCTENHEAKHDSQELNAHRTACLRAFSIFFGCVNSDYLHWYRTALAQWKASRCKIVAYLIKQNYRLILQNSSILLPVKWTINWHFVFRKKRFEKNEKLMLLTFRLRQ